MTIIGILLILAGAAIGLTSPIAYNGQWLLGLIIAFAGLALAAIHTAITSKEKK
ncbi:membrane protein [Microbacterium phage MortySmith]|nr:membrane protein [Microbacterium phage Hiddenleaf]QNJ55687.1 membrane protein [Microbacterium phage FreddieHg]QNN98548.1 membrane protein [Microbacterium phage Chivey]QNN98630.1 membrane protein [Microbacterium phage Aesir]QPX61910.1 membrane protein [Microbacterium phage DannyDe]WNM68272.1 membrane protein [Microbacterium phage JDawG]WNM69140.1 membrane protein [Microbacterium phage Erudite]